MTDQEILAIINERPTIYDVLATLVALLVLTLPTILIVVLILVLT